MIHVEVAYAEPHQQIVITLEVARGTTALRAVELSGIQARLPDVDVMASPMGVFSVLLDGRASPAPGEYVLEEGDRVEIYRPLIIDPKEARLKRAAKARQRRVRSSTMSTMRKGETDE